MLTDQEIRAIDDAHDWQTTSGRMSAYRAVLAAAQAKPEGAKSAHIEQIGPEWRPCVKLPITVHVREQLPGETHISTREGITPVRPDDLIMRGVQGEEYQIGRELFERTYRLGEAKSGPAVAGWQLVPVEPTAAMLGAGLRHVAGMASMPSAWKAMLAAAPSAEGGA